jgi:hypothetical protein
MLLDKARSTDSAAPALAHGHQATLNGVPLAAGQLAANGAEIEDPRHRRLGIGRLAVDMGKSRWRSLGRGE